MNERVRAAAWMFVTAMRTEQRSIGRNPLLLIYSGVLPTVYLIITVETHRPDRVEAPKLVSAVVLTALWASTIWLGGGVMRRERTYGTLARCVSGVHPPFLVLVGKSLGATVYSVGVALSSATVTVLALRVPISLDSPLWIIVALAVLTISAGALGTLLACLFLVTRYALIWSGALMYPVFVLGGLLIPPGTLPHWLRWFPRILSLHWINEFLARASTGSVSLTPLGVAAALTVCYFAVAGWALRAAIRAACRKGNLDFF